MFDIYMNQDQLLNNIVLGDLAEDENEGFIQIIDSEKDENSRLADFPEAIPILPIRNTVLFPGVVLPITVGRQKSIKLVKKAYKGDRIIGVVAQKNNTVEEPEIEDIYHIGTVAKIIKMIVLPDGNTTIIIQGKNRFKIRKFLTDQPYFTAAVKYVKEKFLSKHRKETKAVVQSLKDAASKILKLNPEIPQEAQVALDNIESHTFLTHFLSSNINAEVADKQKLLEIDDGMERATILLEHMHNDIQMLELKQEIHNKVHSDIDQQQRDFYLRQQIKVLQDELGHDGPDQEVEALRVRGDKKKWPQDIRMHFNKELDKILRLNPASAEYPVAFGYVELFVDLPWGEYTTDNFDLNKARRILDRDHYGLDKIKDRIIEYLAVLKLKQDMKGPILCFVGPPGVGKTSLGRSIAESLNRRYIRMSLGGVHDEAEVRGHRKTYVGAMPGRIVQNIKKVKSSNPVFILDEIDKVRSDFRGDPSSALLEVLDPEQNSTFTDNYLEVPYDLSKVLFIATANFLDTIHPALRDRMEIIELSGYTLEEKVKIAQKHLLPKQKKEHGLKAKDFRLSKKALVKIVEGYTRESGVRNLERKIGTVARKIAKSIALEEEFVPLVDVAQIESILGPSRFDKELYQDNKIAGVVTGLAWTQAGGEILFIESSLSRGKGKLTLSGQLGDVMKESAVTALSYLRSNAESLNIDHRTFDNYDLHVHVPAGAVPKDGPSAGITIATSLASVFTQRKVKDKIAMTGEITLRGKVLPVGGVKEKILAARRAGIKEIVLSERNRKDIEEISQEYLKGLKVHFVDTVNEVLQLALLKQKAQDAVSFVFRDN